MVPPLLKEKPNSPVICPPIPSAIISMVSLPYFLTTATFKPIHILESLNELFPVCNTFFFSLQNPLTLFDTCSNITFSMKLSLTTYSKLLLPNLSTYYPLFFCFTFSPKYLSSLDILYVYFFIVCFPLLGYKLHDIRAFVHYIWYTVGI